MNIAVFASGDGSNLQNIIDNIEIGAITNCKVSLVVSDNYNAYALQRAKSTGIPTICFEKKNFKLNLLNDLVETLSMHNVELIVLAGFMSILSKDFVSLYENKIINIHPSLIPAFCGYGQFGINVHKNAINYGVKVTGATVHLVNEYIDNGAIIMQKAVQVLDSDTAESLQNRVKKEAEWEILSIVIQFFCNNKIKFINGRCYII